jgi:hypothetical protein
MIDITRTLHRAFGAALVAGAIMAAPAALHAQGTYAGVGFLTSYPQGEFKDHVDHAGFGAELHGGYHFGKVPLMLGGEIGIMSYGSTSREEPFSTTIPDVTVRVETSNNIAHGNLFLRLQPDEGVVRPYAEGVFGTNYFFTQTTIRDNGHWSSDDQSNEVASSTNQDDWGLMYGGGGGLLVKVFETEITDEGSPATSTLSSKDASGSMATGFITLGFRYLHGGKAEYLTSGSIHRSNGQVSYDVTTSRTDLITGQLGFEMRF